MRRPPTRFPATLAVPLLVAGALACGKSGGDGAGGSGGSAHDAAAADVAAVAHDAAAAGDAAPTNCAGIRACVYACADDMACASQCVASAPAAARTAYQMVVTCSTQQCPQQDPTCRCNVECLFPDGVCTSQV